mmetsp:Transcript_22570/g.85518  ORF Transcript_22570/g.85518 Transcript_22570/m.85518 type:complete len:243 (-) Transcript_22570:1886-2614(-)
MLCPAGLGRRRKDVAERLAVDDTHESVVHEPGVPAPLAAQLRASGGQLVLALAPRVAVESHNRGGLPDHSGRMRDRNCRLLVVASDHPHAAPALPQSLHRLGHSLLQLVVHSRGAEANEAKLHKVGGLLHEPPVLSPGRSGRCPRRPPPGLLFGGSQLPGGHDHGPKARLPEVRNAALELHSCVRGCVDAHAWQRVRRRGGGTGSVNTGGRARSVEASALGAGTCARAVTHVNAWSQLRGRC